jgi:uncharacterized protein (TIGR03435 family)
MLATRIIGLLNGLPIVLSVALSGSWAVWTARGLAQSSTGLPEFDVAEIKLDRSANPMSADYGQAGHLHLTGFPHRPLMAAAWQVKPYAIEGGPAWLDSDRFDVAANAPQGTSPKDVQLMLRNLLIERFRLVAHNGEKVMAAYALVVGKGGPKLQETTAGSSDPMGCAGQREQGMAHRTCKNTSMAVFADSLPGMSPHYIDLPVVNLTGLDGRYDFKLSWQPQQLQGKGGDLPGPTIFDAVRDQFGLKLESRRLPVQTIVIDKIERLGGEN